MLHIICERDVGLFSLIQQVISNVPWALAEGRVPVVCFRDRTCYWSPRGYAGRSTVWEYYFEPLVQSAPASSVPAEILARISERHPSPFEVGYRIGSQAFVTAHFGDHPDLRGLSLRIPFELADPSDSVRTAACDIISKYITPRQYISDKADDFFDRYLRGYPVIGVHVRGTDSVSDKEVRSYRKDSFNLLRYLDRIQRLIERWPSAKVFVATDARSSLDWLRSRLGERVVWRSSILHETGEAAGEGPTGWIMPAYVSADREVAARNGEEAVIDYLLLSRCDHLVHNGAGLARTVLLNAPEVPHSNTHARAEGAHRSARAVDRRMRTRERLRQRSPTTRDNAHGDPPVSPEIIARVKAEKSRRRASGVRYVDFPRVGFVVQSFNRAANIDNIHRSLSGIPNRDLIVCDDGSLDGSRERWASLLTEPNDFLILSNDLHEIRILDRAVRFSRADIVCIVQDDDQIPTDRAWLENALARFDALPELAILGGFMGFQNTQSVEGNAEVLWGPCPFVFILHVNIGPYFMRRSAYEALGGWDYSYSGVGEPGICFDNELCLRAWRNGYKVGYQFVPFKGQPGNYACDGGTVLFGGTRRRVNMRRNLRAISREYSEHIPELNQLVRRANASLGATIDGHRSEIDPPGSSACGSAPNADRTPAPTSGGT